MEFQFSLGLRSGQSDLFYHVSTFSPETNSGFDLPLHLQSQLDHLGHHRRQHGYGHE